MNKLQCPEGCPPVVDAQCRSINVVNNLSAAIVTLQRLIKQLRSARLRRRRRADHKRNSKRGRAMPKGALGELLKDRPYLINFKPHAFASAFAVMRLNERGRTISKRSRDVLHCIKRGQAFQFVRQQAAANKVSTLYQYKVREAAMQYYARYPVASRKLMETGMKELYQSQGRAWDKQAQQAFHRLTQRSDGLKMGGTAMEYQQTVAQRHANDTMRTAFEHIASDLDGQCWTQEELDNS